MILIIPFGIAAVVCTIAALKTAYDGELGFPWFFAFLSIAFAVIFGMCIEGLFIDKSIVSTVCPNCGAVYSAEAEYCEKDGEKLNFFCRYRLGVWRFWMIWLKNKFGDLIPVHGWKSVGTTPEGDAIGQNDDGETFVFVDCKVVERRGTDERSE